MAQFPTFVSLTGADTQTKCSDLVKCAAQFPRIEWAILYLPDWFGRARYPDADWISDFLSQAASTKKALHLCDEGVTLFFEEDPKLWDLAARFDRVQINFFQKHTPVTAAQLDALALAFPKPLIVPHNPANEEVVEQTTAPSIQFLFDSSGGKGTSPAAWPAALPGRSCGYAGGLGPETLAAALPLIRAAAAGAPFWIDMESRLRDENDLFSLEKCRAVLELVDQIAAKS